MDSKIAIAAMTHPATLSSSPGLQFQYFIGIIQAVGAIGTLLVALIALGSRLRTRLFGPKLLIDVFPLHPSETPAAHNNDQQAWYILLQVKNLRPWRPARSCRVELRKVERLDTNGAFQQAYTPATPPFLWSPGDQKKVERTVAETAVFDLGVLFKQAAHFRLRTDWVPNNDPNVVGAGDTLRYHLKAYAEDAAPSRCVAVEVRWDGKWANTWHEMQGHLMVKVLDQKVI